MKKNQLLLLFLSIAVLMTSCRRDEELPDPIDRELDLVLFRASGGRGKAFYRMPSSTDYSAIPQDPKNPITDAKVRLGKLLFHETGLSLNSKTPEGLLTYSCATCHHARAGFQSGTAQGLGDGGVGFGIRGEARHPNPLCPKDSCDMQPLKSPSAMNIAYQTNVLWNGQFGATHVNTGTNNNWTQGTPKEMNNLGFQGAETQAVAGQSVHRMKLDTALLSSNIVYKKLFDEAFPEVPASERISNITVGLAIAAYERTLLSNAAPFQKYVSGNADAMSEEEKKGALLFFGKAECYKCHNGPALNSMNFYALGFNDMKTGNPGVTVADPDKVDNLGRGSFTGLSQDNYKFKVPQLYNLKDAGFFGHGSTFRSVREVVDYKNSGVSQNAKVPSSQLAGEFKPLGLSEEEVSLLVKFIEQSLYDHNLNRYVPSALPSGQCFPNNDTQTKLDIGCF